MLLALFTLSGRSRGPSQCGRSPPSGCLFLGCVHTEHVRNACWFARQIKSRRARRSSFDTGCSHRTRWTLVLVGAITTCYSDLSQAKLSISQQVAVSHFVRELVLVFRANWNLLRHTGKCYVSSQKSVCRCLCWWAVPARLHPSALEKFNYFNSRVKRQISGLVLRQCFFAGNA